MKTKELKNKNTGFTLIETLVYVAIFSIFVGSLVYFLNLMTTSRINNQITLEVNNQGNDVIRIITQSVRNADNIDSPLISSTSSSLELLTSNPTTSPTIFSEIDGVLYITEGGGSPVALTNNKVAISNLVFSNLSLPGTPGSIQVRFTMSSIVSNPNYINKLVNFYGTGTIKK